MSRRRGAKRRAVDTKMDEQRQRVFRNGPCETRSCGEEMICEEFPKNTHTCICTFDLRPPTTEGTCPRETVPMREFRGEIEQRPMVVRDGPCNKGTCGDEMACHEFQNITHTCICKNDSHPPTTKNTCPTAKRAVLQSFDPLPRTGKIMVKRNSREKHVVDSPEGASQSVREKVIRNGLCEKGACGEEAACKDLENNTHMCICTQDSLPPTVRGTCPRETVPMENPPRILVQPRSNKVTPSSLSSTTIPVTAASESIPGPDYVILAIVISACLFLLILSGLLFRRKFRARHLSNDGMSPVNLKHSLLMAERYAPNPQYSACSGTGVPVLRKETLKFISEIGEGCFGKVYKGELLIDGSDRAEIVAVKVLKENATREAEEDFIREVEIMSAFRHNNILSLLGMVVREGVVSPMMVFEYMPHGDLAELLRAQKTTANENEVPQLEHKHLLSVALQIASGMKYLAAQRFVHRDLACRNCLVAEGPIVKIADFGMSRDVYTCDYYKIGGSRLLPVRWMSPESVLYGRFTLESDIWSYGVVLWEIYSFGKQPYYGHTNEEAVKLILDGIMLIPPEDCPSLICELMKNCWKTEPRDRIKFPNICDKLELAYENVDLHFENEIEKAKSVRTLPRPPPLRNISQEDLLDAQGYLLANEVKEPVQYLETLPD